jgi:uncharacterized membrane protein (UPF0127 family)
MKNPFNWLLVLGFLLLGCENSQLFASPDAYVLSQEATENKGQMLPIGAKVMIGDQVVELEVAKTSEQQSLGLMYRESLADDRGMLFGFELPRVPRFWMKNVPINLDMVFLYRGEVKAIISDAPPCTSNPCPIYGTDNLIDRVIELRGGRAAELGLKEGDRLTIEFLP